MFFFPCVLAAFSLFLLYQFSFQNRQQCLDTSRLQQGQNTTTANTEGSVTDEALHGDDLNPHISEMEHNIANVFCGSNKTETQDIEKCSSPPSATNSTTNNICRVRSNHLVDQNIQLEFSEALNRQQLHPSNCHSKRSSGSGVEWFECIQAGTQGISISPISKSSEFTSIKPQTEAPKEPEAVSSDFNKSTTKANTSKQPTEKSSNEARGNNLPDEVVTVHVSKKWHKLNKKSMKSTINGPSTMELCGDGDPSEEAHIASAGPLHSTPARGRKRRLMQVDTGKGTSDIQDPELQAKLAKFSFKQKTKLVHCPGIESELTADSGDNDRQAIIGTEPKKKSSHSEKLRRLLEVSVSSDNANSVRQGKSSCAAPTEVTFEKDDVSHVVSTSILVNEENKQTAASLCRKVSTSTLAKLTKFSFTSSSEDKIADAPGVNPGSKNPLSSLNLGAGGKRKCFQLEPFTNKTSKSLFCSTDLDDETLDLDWNIEMKGKN